MAEFEFQDNLWNNFDAYVEPTLDLKEGERRVVSVLFADIKGFTSISEKLDSEQLQELSDVMLKVFSFCIKKYGGYIDKYQGDKIMAFFGAREASEKDTQRAIYSGLEIIEQLKKLNQFITTHPVYSKKDIELKVRVGISTGPVVTGKMGVGRDDDFTVYGDTVGIASLMEIHAPANKVHVSQETMSEAHLWFIFKQNTAVDIHEKLNGLQTYIVESIKDENAKPEHDTTAFVGRGDELQLLNQTFSSLSKNYFKEKSFVAPKVVLIKAEAGMGKSRLINEFIKEQKLNTNSYLIGHASNLLKNPYRIFIILIKRYFQLLEDDSLSVTQAKFERAVNQLLETIADEKIHSNLEQDIPILGFLLGINYNDRRLLSGGGKDIQIHVQLAVRHFIQSIAISINTNNSSPLLLILEDLQWIDESSLTALVNLMQTLYGSDINFHVPILFVCSCRTDFQLHEDILKTIRLTELALPPLKENESEKLIDIALHFRSIDSKIKSLLLERSSGNPFYIEEWTSLIKENNFLNEEGNLFTNEELDLAVPNSINAIILSRVDKLEPTVKLLLQKASVIGRSFQLKVLENIEKKLNRNVEINKGITTLVNGNFIQPISEKKDIYQFKHVLIHEVVYNTLLQANKSILHAIIAELIESSVQRDKEEHVFDLAYHYARTTNIEKAAFYLFKAGEKAQQNLNNELALILYTKLLKIVSVNGIAYRQIKVDALSKASSILILLSRYDEAREHINEAIKLAEAIHYENGMASSYYYMGNICFLKAENENAIRCLTIAHKLFTKQNNFLGLTQCLSKLGSTYWNSGNLDKGMSYLQQSLLMAAEHRLKREIAEIIGSIGLIYKIKGNLEKAIECFNQQIKLFTDLGDEYSAALGYGNLGTIYRATGEYGRAMECYDIKINASERMGDKYGLYAYTANMGILFLQMRNYKNAMPFINKAIKGCEDIGISRFLPLLYVVKGEIYYNLQEFHNAKKWVEKGLDYGKDKNSFLNDKFEGTILLAKINFALEPNYTHISNLKEIIFTSNSTEEKADLHYEIWKMLIQLPSETNEAEQYQNDAIAFYEISYSKTPKIELKEKLDELKSSKRDKTNLMS